MSAIHIPELAPEELFQIGPLPVTNTIINAWIAILFFLVLGCVLRSRLALRPGKLQNGVEYILELVLPYFDQVTGSREQTKRFLPIVGSTFFFILLSNWLGLLPGTGSILIGGSPALRPANTDLNLTLAMALVSVLSSHLFAFASVGFFTHIGKFVQLHNLVGSLRHGFVGVLRALIEFGVGLIEIISEGAKVLSLSLRLFGNIFAGEVLLSVMQALIAAIVPVPFMFLELLVGLIQAGVFAMLTLVYLTVASAAPHGAGEH